MRCTLSSRPRRICLLTLVLLWCGAAHAIDPVHLALATPPQATWQPHDLTLSGTLPAASSHWLDIRVKRGDTLSALFGQAGLPPSQWRAMLALGDTVDPLRHLNPGDRFRLRKTPDGRLAALHFPLGPTKTLVVRRTTSGLSAAITRLNSTTRRILAEGVVGTSFPTSLRRAGVPARMATALAHIFEPRKNLSRDMRRGDRFSVIYAAEYVGGSQVDTGPVIAASIHAGAQTYRVFRQVTVGGEASYYDASGQPFEPRIERTPLNYSHVSSGFDLHRRNPVLGVVRPHTGVDLAAPRGTQVHAAASGTVTFVGWLSGYGRIVEIDHAGGYSTRYAHLSGFAAGLDKGERVHQDQPIGYVGESGLATGYHLHYEILENGTPHDPLTMQLPDGKPLTGPVLTAFSSRIQLLVTRMDGNGPLPQTLVAANRNFAATQTCAESGAINAVMALAPGQVKDDALSRVFCIAG